MNNKQRYRDTFAQVRFTGRLVPEEIANRNRPHSIKRLVMLAAVICVLAVLGITAGASGMFGLQGMVLRPDRELSAGTDSTGNGQEPPEISIPVETYDLVDTISLSGFAGSPEKQAVAEWQQFLSGYDADKELLNAVGNNPTGLEQKYGLYYVYTQEMADKLEEITAKYSLRLHTQLSEVPGTWDRAAGGTFLAESVRGFYGYMYEDGSFHFDGEWNISDSRILNFQFGRWVKGSFNEVVLSIGYADDYREWTYMTDCGIAVTLAISPHKSLVLMEAEDAIITINVLEGSDTGYLGNESGITEEILEAFADSIDFTVLSPVREPILPLEEPVQQPEGDLFLQNTGITEAAAQEFYCALYRAVDKNRRQDVAEMIAWPRKVVTPDGEFFIQSAEEFLPHYADVFTDDVVMAMQHNQYTMERADLFAWDGQVCGAGGEIRFGLVDGAIRVQTVHVPAASMGISVPEKR
ncbi:MAG: hypothetical protein E7445_05160 [Ruminococcaceae bacterium]|nr:hypothetical protein [Oscillospiraceae bacterium]